MLFLKLEHDKPKMSWEDFKMHGTLPLGSPFLSNKLDELVQLHQIRIVND